MEDAYVHKTYEAISTEFDRTRFSHWLSVKEFVSSLPSDAYVLDAGCGNGKNMTIREDIRWLGCDTSESLLNICKQKGLTVVNANIKALPFPDNQFDAIICIAVIHHIYLEKDRLIAVNELIRVLKPGGSLLFQVWAREQELTKKFSRVNESNDPNDFYVTWNGGEKRYYHLFSESDIDSLIKQIPNITLIKKEYEKDNWVVILKK